MQGGYDSIVESGQAYDPQAKKLAPYLTEAVGTFFLCLTVALANGDLAPLAVGAVLMGQVRGLKRCYLKVSGATDSTLGAVTVICIEQRYPLHTETLHTSVLL